MKEIFFFIVVLFLTTSTFKVYPTKKNGREWIMKDPTKDEYFFPRQALIKHEDGWRNTKPQVRMVK